MQADHGLSIEKVFHMYQHTIHNPVGLVSPTSHELELLLFDKNPLVREGAPIKFNFFSLILSLSGEIARNVNQFDYVIKPYCLQLMPPGTLYHFESRTKESEATVIFFKEDFLGSVQHEQISNEVTELIEYHRKNFVPIQLSLCEFRAIKQLFSDIEEELFQKKIGYRTIIQLLLFKLLVLFKRYKETQPHRFNLHPCTNETVSKYLSLIEEYYLTLHKVSDYAKLLNLTPKYLGEIAKQELGKNALFYIHHRRLKEALYLLKHTELTISQISTFLGFKYHSDFNRFFTKYYYMTPKEYKNQPQYKVQYE